MKSKAERMAEAERFIREGRVDLGPFGRSVPIEALPRDSDGFGWHGSASTGFDEREIPGRNPWSRSNPDWQGLFCERCGVYIETGLEQLDAPNGDRLFIARCHGATDTVVVHAHELRDIERRGGLIRLGRAFRRTQP